MGSESRGWLATKSTTMSEGETPAGESTRPSRQAAAPSPPSALKKTRALAVRSVRLCMSQSQAAPAHMVTPMEKRLGSAVTSPDFERLKPSCVPRYCGMNEMMVYEIQDAAKELRQAPYIAGESRTAAHGTGGFAGAADPAPFSPPSGAATAALRCSGQGRCRPTSATCPRY